MRHARHHAAAGERAAHRAERHRLAVFHRTEPQRDAAVRGGARALDPGVRPERHLAVAPETLRQREAREAARAVAAELGDTAVRVVVAHDEIVRVVPLEQEHAVRADAAAAIAQLPEQLTPFLGEEAIAVVDDHEVVPRAVHLRERDPHAGLRLRHGPAAGFCGRTSTNGGTSMTPPGGTVSSVSTLAGSSSRFQPLFLSRSRNARTL